MKINDNKEVNVRSSVIIFFIIIVYYTPEVEGLRSDEAEVKQLTRFNAMQFHFIF